MYTKIKLEINKNILLRNSRIKEEIVMKIKIIRIELFLYKLSYLSG